MEPINYLITDDHSIFRKGLRLALSDDEHLQCLGEAGDGQELLELLKEVQPDVILLDLKMPKMDGMEATKEIRKRHPDVKILILTMHDDEQLVVHLMEAGANGYLIKNADADEIKLALHACKENGYYFSDYVSGLMLRSIMHKSKPQTKFKEGVVLNEREREVLTCLCEGMTATEIGQKVFLSARTVEGIKATLFEKIGARNVAGLIMYAVKQGIVS
jgi:DNA-binding NarL/FixJ family response regulator